MGGWRVLVSAGDRLLFVRKKLLSKEGDQGRKLNKDERLEGEPVLFKSARTNVESESEARITLEEIRKHPWMAEL